MADPENTESSEFQPAEQTGVEPMTELCRPLRVAWVASSQTFSHVGRILHPLAIGLMDEMVGVTILVPERSDQRELPNLPLLTINYSNAPWLMFRNRRLATMSAELVNRQISLLHALDASAAEIVQELAEAADLPYVVSSYSLGDARRLGGLDERCQCVLAASEPIRRELLFAQITAERRIQLVRPGVYHVGHATCFSDPSRSVAIVAGGQLDDYVAYEALLRSFNEVRSRNYDCAFFIIGNGKSEGRIRLAAEKLEIRSRLTFVDRQPATQLQGILKPADIYISPVSTQQVDIVSLLAMAAGDPVLAARSVADDFFIDGRTAMLFTSGNAAELTQKLISILEDQQSARNLADGALAYLHENHGAAKMVGEVTQIYRQACQAHRPAAASRTG